MDRFRTSTRRPAEPVPLTDGDGTGSGGTLVGVRTIDGVVLVSDTRTRRDSVVCSEGVRKIARIHPTAAMGSTDDLGGARSVLRTIRSAVDLYEKRRGEPMDATALTGAVAAKLRSRSAPAGPFVLGCVDHEGPHVFTLERDGGVLEDEYAAVGSGRGSVYGSIDAEAPESPSMVEARRIAGRAVEGASERDGWTGEGVQVAEITADGVDIERHDSVDELL
ncbi:proteasome subunit beta [Natrinema caseinilyticum]|uniref:proteasome subunit beta n=1 Tax=Natrinema caseinilyticum TaxID=2961570 RepID=UPI0020C4C325|nr:proteasome subunit beta [Natrinema caseinilyticum]